MIDALLRWLTDEKRSTYGLAACRILLGLIVSTQLLANFADRRYTWGIGTAWTEPVRRTKAWPQLLANVDPWLFDVVYIAAILAGLALMVGFSTRASTILTLVLWMALYVSNPFVGSGGDAVLRMVLLYACFAELGRHWSVDAWLRQHKGTLPALLPDWLSNLLHNLALVLIVHQIIMVYVGSAFWKVQSTVWMDGTATYYPLKVEAYSPWRDLIEAFVNAGPLMMGATWTAIALQLFFPVLLLYKPTRILALFAVTGMHLAIGLLMGILFFSLVMIAVDLLLVSDKSWAEFLKRLKTWKVLRLSHKSETKV